MSTYERIFAAIDGGESQRKVCERAIELASANNADLFLGHVVDAVASEASKADMDLLTLKVKDQILEAIGDLIQKAEDDPNIKSVTLKVVAGGLPETLGNVLAEQFEPDLVICCKRGFSGLRYAFVGSVSTYLVRNMDCDVLVIDKA